MAVLKMQKISTCALKKERKAIPEHVYYTQLTLPQKRREKISVVAVSLTKKKNREKKRREE